MNSNDTKEQQSSSIVKRDLTDTLKIFYKELVEITIDFLSNNMFLDTNTDTTQYQANHNRGKHFVDIYDNSTYANV